MAALAIWLSIGLILFGLLLVLLEAANPGFFIAVPGTIMVGLGIMGLIAPHLLFGPWAAISIPVFGIPATIATIWAYKKWAPPGEKPITMSSDSLPGETGTVERAISPTKSGLARVQGTVWRATAHTEIAAGTRIRVVSADSLTLTVEPLPSIPETKKLET